MFSFEALKASHGDALVVHYGPELNPQMILVDGGPGRVFENALQPRLEQMAFFREERPLTARLAMVSHIDDDHIIGIEKLLRHIDQSADPVVEVEGLWHNSFDDDINTAELAMLAGLGGISDSAAASLGISRFVKQIAAGVPSGRRLRDLAEQQALVTNAGGQRPGFISEGDEANIGHGTRMRVLNPDRGQLFGLQQKWDGVANRLGNLSPEDRLIVLARIADDSLANIASIVVHISKGGSTMLLTGDARGDNVVSGMRRAGLLPNGHAHVDILKVPHHGSDRNVDTAFFTAITADNYVFSGDRHGPGSNPDRATIQMVLEVRDSDPYTMYFTNTDANIRRWIREDRNQNPNRNYDVVFSRSQDHGIWIDLEDEQLWF